MFTTERNLLPKHCPPIYHLEAWRLSLIGEGGESVRKALSAEETDTGFMNGGRSHISPVRGVKLRRLTPHTGLSL